jgi:hypothetical protein
MRKLPTHLALSVVAAAVAATTLAGPASALQNDASSTVSPQLIPSDPAVAVAYDAQELTVQVADAAAVRLVMSAHAASVRSQLDDLRS